MCMIRTKTVDLTTIPAVAYRQKLKSGGSGIVIVRRDYHQPGIASISKNTGTAIPTSNTPLDQYPEEAFAEALELTNGLTYKHNNEPVVVGEKEEVEEPITEEEKEEEVVVDSVE